MTRLGIFGVLIATALSVACAPAMATEHGVTAAELGRQIRLGQTTSEQATKELLERIARLDRAGLAPAWPRPEFRGVA